jgi:glycosyltransferase involved in cell wall biosynthesis
LWTAARKSGSALFHIQDPELLVLGIALRVAGSRVIYDVHENYPKVVYARQWIPRRLRWAASIAVDILEKVAARALNGVIGVVEEQGQRFARSGSFEVVKNFPRTEWFVPNGHAGQDRFELIHVGSFSRDRGSEFIIDVLREVHKTRPQVRLQMVGVFHAADEEESFRGLLEEYGLCEHVRCHTRPVPYDALGKLISGHRIGLIPGQVTVKNLSPFVPTKLFEYLACGIPVVASALPSIEGFHQCADWGILADPGDPAAHAEAIDFLLRHPREATLKGERGRALVLERFNWNSESSKLVGFYDRILKAG